jgi:hypothetical protein
LCAVALLPNVRRHQVVRLGWDQALTEELYGSNAVRYIA